MQTFAVFIHVRAEPFPVSINTTERFQVMDGFGASDCWSFQKIGEWNEDKKNEIADLLFSVETGIGLSQWRFNIGGGINQETINSPWRTVETFETGPGEYDWSRQAEERWFLEAAKLRGVEDFIAFVNSPPGRMTRNGLTNCTDGSGTTNLKNGWENQFARYLKDILLHFKEHWNLEFSHISPVNEPQWEWNNGSNQEGNRASNEDIRAIAIALHDSLENAGLQTEISLVESGDLRSWYQFNTGMGSEYGQPYGSYLNTLLDHPDLDGKLAKHIGSHSYWSDRINTQLVQDRQELAYHIRDYLEDGWKYWVTEYTILDGPDGQGGHGRDLSMETAIDVTRVIHHDLTLLNASAWQWWTAVSPEDFKDGLIYTDYRDNISQATIIESKLLWALGHYSRFIRPGYQRVGMAGASNKFGLMGSAFVSDTDDTLVAVFINAASDSKAIDLGVSGHSWGNTFEMYLTSDEAGNDLRRVENVSLDQSIIIPARSLVTLIGSGNTTTPPFEGYDPELYQLYQNYPNPFNSQTRLSFNLPEPGSAELSIYSLRGERVHSVSWLNLTEGLQHYTWAASQEGQSHLNSGVYLYRLRAGNMSKTKKMVFIQ